VLKTVTFIRHNAIALLALFVALGGTSYAAFSLPAGSVGTSQLRNGAVTANKLANGSISPSKLDNRTLGGTIRHWAHVAQNGLVLGGSRGTQASLAGVNQYTVTWGTRFSTQCAAMITPAAVPGIAPLADSIGVGVGDANAGKGNTLVNVWTYRQGSPTTAPFYVAIVC
jgi:hypothetical protein